MLELGDDLLALARADEAALRARRARRRCGSGSGASSASRSPPIAVRGGARRRAAGRSSSTTSRPRRAARRAGEALSLAPPDELALVGIDGAPERDPLTGRAATRVADADARARRGARRRCCGPLERVARRVRAGRCARAAHLLVGVQEAQALLDALEPTAPALVREASRQLPPALLAEVLRRLVEEGVSIRPLRTILEAILEAGGAARGAPALARGLPAGAAAAHRPPLRRGRPARRAPRSIPRAEERVREALAGEALALEPEVAARLLDALEREVRGHDAPPVVLASGDVRRALRGLVAPRFPRVAVLAYDELPPELAVRPVGPRSRSRPDRARRAAASSAAAGSARERDSSRAAAPATRTAASSDAASHVVELAAYAPAATGGVP